MYLISAFLQYKIVLSIELQRNDISTQAITFYFYHHDFVPHLSDREALRLSKLYTHSTSHIRIVLDI